MCDLLCELGTQLILIDDVHPLAIQRRAGAETSDQLKYHLEITQRKPGPGGSPAPEAVGAVERTYGWLMLHRRLARPDTADQAADSGMKQREKTTSKVGTARSRCTCRRRCSACPSAVRER